MRPTLLHLRASGATLAVLCLALLPLPLTQAQEADLEAFGEVIDVRVLNLEVAVTDKDGAHVEGLQPGDFRLLVDGNVVPIEYFSEIRHGSAADLPAAQTIAEAPASTTPSVTPGETVGTSFLLFVDDYFGHARDRQIVLENVIETVPRLGPKDRMAVVSFDGRKLNLVGNWETSRQAIVRNLRQAITAKAGGLKRKAELDIYELQLRNLSTGLISDSLEATQVEYVRVLSQQVDAVVKAATAAMRAMAKPPGRKVMLLTSGGWPDDPSTYAVGLNPDIRNRTRRFSPKPAFDDLAATANKLGYTIYPIDMSGRENRQAVYAGNLEPVGETFLQAPPDTQPDDNPGVIGKGSGDPEISPEDITRDKQETIMKSFDDLSGREHAVEMPLMLLARETGGEAMLNSFRSTALPRTLESTSSYYWLGYTPTWAHNDQAHQVEVEVLHPGAESRSRRSFRDLSRKSEVSMMVESNLLFDTDLRGHSLEATLGEPTKKRANLEQPVSLKIPMDQLVMLPVAGGFEANLELRVAVVDDKGARSEIPVIPVKLNGATKPPPGAVAVYDTTLMLRNIRQQLALVLYDLAGERMLSTSIDFDPGSS